MDKNKKVLELLKPKIQALGFSKEEVKGIAADIADDLDIAEDASDEEAATVITDAIDKQVKFLKYAQKAGNRMIDDWKKQHPEPKPSDDDDDDDLEEEEPKSQVKPKSKNDKGSKKSDVDNKDEEPQWAKEIKEQIASLNGTVSAMKSKEIADKRKARLETILKDTGTFGTRIIKSLNELSFKDDDEFEEYVNGVEEDLKALNKERADAGLSKLGAPPSTKVNTPSKEQELVSDDLIKEIAKD